MFHFPGYASRACAQDHRGSLDGVSPFRNFRIKGCSAPPRNLSQPRYVFHRLLESRHPPYALTSPIRKCKNHDRHDPQRLRTMSIHFNISREPLPNRYCCEPHPLDRGTFAEQQTLFPTRLKDPLFPPEADNEEMIMRRNRMKLSEISRAAVSQ